MTQSSNSKGGPTGNCLFYKYSTCSKPKCNRKHDTNKSEDVIALSKLIKKRNICILYAFKGKCAGHDYLNASIATDSNTVSPDYVAISKQYQILGKSCKRYHLTYQQLKALAQLNSGARAAAINYDTVKARDETILRQERYIVQLQNQNHSLTEQIKNYKTLLFERNKFKMSEAAVKRIRRKLTKIREKYDKIDDELNIKTKNLIDTGSIEGFHDEIREIFITSSQKLETLATDKKQFHHHFGGALHSIRLLMCKHFGKLAGIPELRRAVGLSAFG